MRAAITAPAPLGWPALASARATIFRQFAAGEALEDVREVARQLAGSGVRCIVDHSTEESEEPSARQRNLKLKVALLHTLRRELPTECSFVPVKLTALVAPELLERITLAAASPPPTKAYNGKPSPSAELEQVASSLDAAEQEDLTTALGALRELCIGAREAGIPLLLDAEQTPRQPGDS